MGPGLTPASIMRDVQRGQRGRSMGVSSEPGENWDFDITPPGVERERAALSVTGCSRRRDDDETIMPQRDADLMVNIAQ